MSKVSIIVPIYNCENYLANCIESILNQSFSDFEVLLIDDGSTDSSYTIINTYRYDSRVRIFHQENRGQASARNLGIKNADSKYITFIDSDDYIDKNMIKCLFELSLKENADITICDIIKVKNNQTYYFKNYSYFTDDFRKNYVVSHPGPVAKLYKKDLFTKNNLYFKENTIYEDLATMPLLGIYAKKIAYLDKGYYYYNIYSGSTMKQVAYHDKLENIFPVMEYLEHEFYKRSKEHFIEEIEFLYIEHLLYSASLRFLKFDKIDILKRIQTIIKNKYPNFKKNSYYAKKSWKFKLVCKLFYSKKYKILSVIMKGKKDV